MTSPRASRSVLSLVVAVAAFVALGALAPASATPHRVVGEPPPVSAEVAQHDSATSGHRPLPVVQRYRAVPQLHVSRTDRVAATVQRISRAGRAVLATLLSLTPDRGTRSALVGSASGRAPPA